MKWSLWCWQYWSWAQICFNVSVIVACDMVSFSVACQSDSVDDGRVSEGWILTMFLSVKYAHVAVVSLLLLRRAYSAVLAAQLTTMSIDHLVPYGANDGDHNCNISASNISCTKHQNHSNFLPWTAHSNYSYIYHPLCEAMVWVHFWCSWNNYVL